METGKPIKGWMHSISLSGRYSLYYKNQDCKVPSVCVCTELC